MVTKKTATDIRVNSQQIHASVRFIRNLQIGEKNWLCLVKGDEYYQRQPNEVDGQLLDNGTLYSERCGQKNSLVKRVLLAASLPLSNSSATSFHLLFLVKDFTQTCRISSPNTTRLFSTHLRFLSNRTEAYLC